MPLIKTTNQPNFDEPTLKRKKTQTIKCAWRKKYILKKKIESIKCKHLGKGKL
jgi:hypothetical protein